MFHHFLFGAIVTDPGMAGVAWQQTFAAGLKPCF
jgi:hypothetical protein